MALGRGGDCETAKGTRGGGDVRSALIRTADGRVLEASKRSRLGWGGVARARHTTGRRLARTTGGGTHTHFSIYNM